MDPQALTSADWDNIHKWLTLMWVYFPILIFMAFTLLTAHAFIPSLVMTGHLPASVNKVRWPLTFLAILIAIGLLVVWVFVILLSETTIGNFWGRFLI